MAVCLFLGRAGADGIPGKDGRDGTPGLLQYYLTHLNDYFNCEHTCIVSINLPMSTKRFQIAVGKQIENLLKHFQKCLKMLCSSG